MIRAIVIFAVVIVVISEVSGVNGQICFFPGCKQDECCMGQFIGRCAPKGQQDMPCGCGCIGGLECQNGRCVNPDSTTSEPSISTDSSSTVSPDSASTDMPTGMPTNEGN